MGRDMVKRLGNAIKKACKNFPSLFLCCILFAIGVTPLYLAYYSPYWLLAYSALGAIIGYFSHDTIGKRVFGFCMGLIFCPLIVLGIVIVLVLLVLPVLLMQYSFAWLLLYPLYLFIICVIQEF